MKVIEYNFKPEFLNILIQNIETKSLGTIYNINQNAKYQIDYIIDVILAVSSREYSTRYRLPTNLAKYLNESEYSKYSKSTICGQWF
jgi:hypothetical protein